MLRQQRESGDLAPRPRGSGRRPSLSPKQRQLLRRKVERERDISLLELQAYLREAAQVEAHVSTICRALRRSDLPRKKSA